MNVPNHSRIYHGFPHEDYNKPYHEVYSWALNLSVYCEYKTSEVANAKGQV